MGFWRKKRRESFRQSIITAKNAALMKGMWERATPIYISPVYRPLPADATPDQMREWCERVARYEATGEE